MFRINSRTTNKMLRKWYIPLALCLVLFVFCQIYVSRKPSDEEGVVQMNQGDENYDVRDGVKLVETQKFIEPGDDPDNTIIVKEPNEGEFDEDDSEEELTDLAEISETTEEDIDTIDTEIEEELDEELEEEAIEEEIEEKIEANKHKEVSEDLTSESDAQEVVDEIIDEEIKEDDYTDEELEEEDYEDELDDNDVDANEESVNTTVKETKEETENDDPDTDIDSETDAETEAEDDESTDTTETEGDEESDDTEENVQRIHINSYQRTGSSFIGKLFDVYEPAFFVYEPLEMMYTSLYGVKEDSVIPHNIFFTHEAEHRTIEKDEMTMAEWTMDQVYKCNIQSYPTSMLINIFWSKFTKFMGIGIPYVDCLENAGINMTLDHDTLMQCQQPLRAVCAETFSTQFQEDLDLCRSVLFANGKWQTATTDKVWEQHKGTEFYESRPLFDAYFKCLAPHSEAAKQCAIEHLDHCCMSKDIRVVKTVRAPMELSEILLTKYKVFNIVHLFRDPRGVTLSRMKADWSYAVFENSDPAVLSRTYCRVIMNELIKKEKLEDQFLGRVVSLVHDKLLNDVAAGTKQLFKDLGLPYTQEVQHFIDVYTKMSKRDRWRTTLTVKNIRTIERECEELMAGAGFDVYEETDSDNKERDRLVKEFNKRKKMMAEKSKGTKR